MGMKCRRGLAKPRDRRRGLAKPRDRRRMEAQMIPLGNFSCRLADFACSAPFWGGFSEVCSSWELQTSADFVTISRRDHPYNHLSR